MVGAEKQTASFHVGAIFFSKTNASGKEKNILHGINQPFNIHIRRWPFEGKQEQGHTARLAILVREYDDTWTFVDGD